MLFVGKTGFEPATPWSQTRCATGLRYFPNYSYQVRYSRNCGTTSRTILTRCVTPATAGLLPELFLSGALLPQLRDYFPSYSYQVRYSRNCGTTSRNIFNCGGGGIRTRGTELPVRQFSKLLISATHPPHRLKPVVSGMAKLLKTKQSPKDLCN